MDKKGNKIILIIAILLFCMICFCIYYFFFSDLNSGIKYNNPESMVRGYVESLINKDYKESIKYIYLPDNSFVNRNDFETYIKSKYYYNDIEKMKITSITDEGTTLYNVILNDEDGNTIKMNVELIERTVNDYRVDESDIYITNYLFSVPKNTTVYIDDYEVEKSLIAKVNSEDDVYLLGAIANNEKTFKLVNKLSTKQLIVKPTISNDINKIKIELNDDELKNRAYEFIKSMWNDMYNGYTKKANISTLMKYFDESFSEDDVKPYYTKSFDKISVGRTSIGQYQNYQLTKIVDNSSEPSIILNDELINVNFGYTLSWKWKFYGANSAVKMSMNRYSSLTLKVKDDSFVIYEIPDIGLFNYTSEYTRDF